MSKNLKTSSEWFKQAEYDLDTADSMFQTGRYIYTVFMCHLSIEKALKGHHANKHNDDPPKTHDLTYLAQKLALKLSEAHQEFLEELNDLSVPTRYPDELDSLLKHYKKEKVKKILDRTRELFLCLQKI